MDAEERSDTSALLLVVRGGGWGVAVVGDLFLFLPCVIQKSKKTPAMYFNR